MLTVWFWICVLVFMPFRFLIVYNRRSFEPWQNSLNFRHFKQYCRKTKGKMITGLPLGSGLIWYFYWYISLLIDPWSVGRLSHGRRDFWTCISSQHALTMLLPVDHWIIPRFRVYGRQFRVYGQVFQYMLWMEVTLIVFFLSSYAKFIKPS